MQADDVVAAQGDEGDVINIFSIASGHMYERLQKIMILSVLKHTKSKVKFWLIKNYMSPDMKAIMPMMAKEYGFEVGISTVICIAMVCTLSFNLTKHQTYRLRWSHTNGPLGCTSKQKSSG